MKNEKAKFLAVATPEEWDCWLTLYDLGCGAMIPEEVDKIDPKGLSTRCLFCEASGVAKRIIPGNCKRCMPKMVYGGVRCCTFAWEEKTDRAIERLEAAGVFDELDERAYERALFSGPVGINVARLLGIKLPGETNEPQA